jgi:hypothetical protein
MIRSNQFRPLRLPATTEQWSEKVLGEAGKTGRAFPAISSSHGTQISEESKWRKLAGSRAIDGPIELGKKNNDLRRMKES